MSISRIFSGIVLCSLILIAQPAYAGIKEEINDALNRNDGKRISFLLSPAGRLMYGKPSQRFLDSSLYYAAQSCDANVVESLIKAGANPYTDVLHGLNAYYRAAASFRFDSIKKMINMGYYNPKALGDALQGVVGSYTLTHNHVSMTKYLLDAGAENREYRNDLIMSPGSQKEEYRNQIFALISQRYPEGPPTSPTSKSKESLSTRKIKHKVHPKYPSFARHQGIEADVTLRVWVRPSGTVDRVEVIKLSGTTELDKRATEAVKQWIFEPLEIKNEQWGDITLKFRLD